MKRACSTDGVSHKISAGLLNIMASCSWTSIHQDVMESEILFSTYEMGSDDETCHEVEFVRSTMPSMSWDGHHKACAAL